MYCTLETSQFSIGVNDSKLWHSININDIFNTPDVSQSSKPFKDLSDFDKQIILHGSLEPIKYEFESASGNTYKRNQVIEGVQDLIERRYLETTSSWNKDYYGSYMMDIECPKCSALIYKNISLVLTSYPPQYQFHCEKCGWTGISQ